MADRIQIYIYVCPCIVNIWIHGSPDRIFYNSFLTPSCFSVSSAWQETPASHDPTNTTISVCIFIVYLPDVRMRTSSRIAAAQAKQVTALRPSP